MEQFAPTVAYVLLALVGTLVSIFAGMIGKLIPATHERVDENRAAIARRKRLLWLLAAAFFFVWAHIPLSMIASTVDVSTVEISSEENSVSFTWKPFGWQEWWHFLALFAVSYAFVKLLMLLAIHEARLQPRNANPR